MSSTTGSGIAPVDGGHGAAGVSYTHGKGTLHPAHAHSVAKHARISRRQWYIAGAVLAVAGLLLGYLAYRGARSGVSKIHTATLARAQDPCGPCPRITDVCATGNSTQCVQCNVDPDCPGSDVCLHNTCRASCEHGQTCGGGQVCVDGRGCAACSTGTDCSEGKHCLNGVCVTCISADDCESGEVCDTRTNTCTAPCDGETACPSGTTCDTSRELCVGCLNTDQCTAGNVCDTTTFQCVQCLKDSDCPTGGICSGDHTCHEATCVSPGITPGGRNAAMYIQYSSSSSLCLGVAPCASGSGLCAQWQTCKQDPSQWWVIRHDAKVQNVSIAHVTSLSATVPLVTPSDGQVQGPAPVEDPGDVLETPQGPGPAVLTEHTLPNPEPNTPIEIAVDCSGFYITSTQSKGEDAGQTLWLAGEETAGAAATWATTATTAFVSTYAVPTDSTCQTCTPAM